MALEIKKKQGRMPQKTKINLAKIGVKEINPLYATIGIIVIGIAAALFSKFAVMDRLTEVSKAQAEASVYVNKLNEVNAEIEEYGDLLTKYSHYTYSGWNETELTLQNRMEILEVIDRVVLTRATVQAIQMTGNVVTLPIVDLSLQEINKISELLEQEEIVSFCVVTSAVKKDSEEESRVTGQVTIYFENSDEEVYQ